MVVEVPLGASTQLALPEIEPEPADWEIVAIPEGWNPMTVTVQVEGEPELTLAGLHNSVVLEAALVTVSVVDAMDGALLRSPT